MRTSVPGRTSCSRPGLGIFLANAAWLTCAAFAHNLLRAAWSLASLAYARARGPTIRRDLIDVAARTALSSSSGPTTSATSRAPAGARTALAAVDPAPYFQKYGENLWAAVRGYLDSVADAAAAPVIKKYTGVLGAVDVFTAPTAFSILESIRLDLGYRMDVHP